MKRINPFLITALTAHSLRAIHAANQERKQRVLIHQVIRHGLQVPDHCRQPLIRGALRDTPLHRAIADYQRRHPLPCPPRQNIGPRHIDADVVQNGKNVLRVTRDLYEL